MECVDMEIKGQFTVPLAEAAHRLGWTWGRAFNAILSHQLAGERRGGRWFVSGEQLDRLVEARCTRKEQDR
jgi:phage FluMu gp28-like protein